MAPNSTDGGRVTLREVAEVAGVHPGTASRALNADTRALVNEETARRVLRAADELGYRPNPIARGLKTNRSYTVGVVIPDLMNPLFPPIVRGIQDRLEEAAYTPLIANTDNDRDRERADFEAMRARRVDGIITATARLDTEEMANLTGLGMPVVLVNRRLERAAVPSVVGDDRAGMMLVIEHLVELGHRRIAFLAGPQDLSTGRLRYEGFIEAMEGAGLDVDPELVLIGDALVESEGARLSADLLTGEQRPTAIVAANDLMALGCYDVLDLRGIECPAEISVTGFNDMPFTGHFRPPLTTVRIPHYELGARSAELLLQLLENPDTPATTETLAPELIVRKSTAPPAED